MLNPMSDLLTDSFTQHNADERTRCPFLKTPAGQPPSKMKPVIEEQTTIVGADLARLRAKQGFS